MKKIREKTMKSEKDLGLLTLCLLHAILGFNLGDETFDMGHI